MNSLHSKLNEMRKHPLTNILKERNTRKESVGSFASICRENTIMFRSTESNNGHPKEATIGKTHHETMHDASNF